MSKFETIVIGAGHNGLTTAALLAKQGRKVLVLERSKTIGGLASGLEFHPGYFSASLLQDASTVRDHVMDRLNLTRHGLSFSKGRHDRHVFHENIAFKLGGNTDQSCSEIARFFPEDAESYRKYRAFIERIERFVNNVVSDTIPDVIHPSLGDFYSLMKKAVALRWLGKQDMMEVLRVAPMCVADFLNEWFKHQPFKAALSVPGVRGDFVGPWSPATNASFLIWEATSRFTVKGGPRALVAALQKAAAAFGAEIRTEAEVQEIRVEQGRVKGVTLKNGEQIEAKQVLASADPQTVFLKLIKPHHVPTRLAERISNWRMRGTTAQVNFALKAQPVFKNVSVGSCPEYAVIAGGSLDEVEKQFDPLKYKRFAERPVLEVHCPTLSDPSLAPEGHHVLSALVHFAPYELKDGWTEESREGLTNNVRKQLENVVLNLSSDQVATHLLTPQDIERHYGVKQGNIHHGEMALDQMLMRPSPETMRYKTPIEGLSLCGSGSFPGGGITCAPGALAASILLKS